MYVCHLCAYGHLKDQFGSENTIKQASRAWVRGSVLRHCEVGGKESVFNVAKFKGPHGTIYSIQKYWFKE